MRSRRPGGRRMLARPISREAFEYMAFACFCAFAASMQLYDDYSIMSSVAVFNGALYCCMARAAVFVACGIAGIMNRFRPHRLVAVLAGVAACVCAVLEAMPLGLLASGVVSVLHGASLAALSVAWGCYLGRSIQDTSCLHVVLGLLVGCSSCYVVYVVNNLIVGQAVFAVLSLMSGLLWLFPRVAEDQSGGADGPAAALPSFTVPVAALVALGMCCLLSAFFSGVTLNPYAVQSKTITAWMHSAAALFFLAITVGCFAWRAISLQVLVPAGLAVLLVGLFMMSSGVVGSVIMPIGLILSTRNLFWGLGWIVVAALGRVRQERALAVASWGLLVVDGGIGRGIGVLMENSASASFSDLAVFGAVCIVLVAIIYALMGATDIARTPIEVGFRLAGKNSPEAERADAVVEVVSAAADSESESAAQIEAVAETAGSQDEFPSCDFTNRELQVARLLMQNMTYADIAAALDVSESTVKFHAKNAYSKAEVATKREFFMKFATASEPLPEDSGVGSSE